MKPNIHLHIERLVLDGLNIGQGQGTQIKAVVEAELSRLLTEGWLSSELQSGGAIPVIKTNPIQINNNINPSGLGEKIASAVYGGIGK